MKRQIKYMDNYIVYDDGHVFSLKSNKFFKTPVKNIYTDIHLENNAGVKRRCSIHRLVAELFLDSPTDLSFNQINHKNGIKTDNRVENLEWCNSYLNNKHARDTRLNDVSLSNHKRWKDTNFRKRTSANISRGRICSGCCAGNKNPKFKYIITDSSGTKLSVSELALLLNLAVSTTYGIIQHRFNKKEAELLKSHQILIKTI